MKIAALQRFPVKGLSAEALPSARLKAGAFFPGDRVFAFENGRSNFDPAAPAYQPKTRFLMLMKNARLAQLSTRYDEESHRLTIMRAGDLLAEGDLRTAEGRLSVESCLADFCSGETRGPVRLLASPEGFRFTDSIRSGFVSILNLASVRDLGTRLGVELDPLRFRANIHVEDWEPWAEETTVGRTISMGSVRFKALKGIDRCPATHVDPTSGLRDLDIMGALRDAFGHIACGVYASVLDDGEISVGDRLQVVEPA